MTAATHAVAASFEDLFVNAPCGYVVLDLRGAIVQANKAFLELSKLDPDKVVGASFRNLLGSAGAIFFDTQLLPALLLNGRRKEIDLDLRTPKVPLREREVCHVMRQRVKLNVQREISDSMEPIRLVIRFSRRATGRLSTN